MEVKRIYFILTLLFFNILSLYSQEVLHYLFDMEIPNPCIKRLVLEIENHLSEIPDDENFIMTEDFELIINSIERYETKADEASGEKMLQEEIFYNNKKEEAYLFIRKYKYRDGHYILSFSYTGHGIKKLKIKYFWNDVLKKYELCN